MINNGGNMSTQQTPEYDPNILLPQDAITVTEAALQHLKKTISKQKKCIGLIFGIKKSGCSGFAYEVQLTQENTNIKNYYVFPIEDGISIFVKPANYPFIKGTQIDYIREGLNFRFQFNNPNEKGGCGCGESFTV